MKTKLAIVCILLACGAIGYGVYRLAFSSAELRDGSYEVVICATGDVHGAYFEKGYRGEERHKSSLARVATFIENVRANGKNPIVLDLGDAYQGDMASYYYNYVDTVSEHIFASMTKYIGYDAYVVGNHDIETGHAVYDRVRRDLGKPYLAANAIRTGEGEEAGLPYFDDYTMIDRDGIRIAVIGMTNANIGNWLSDSLWYGMEFSIISDIAQQMVDSVQAAHRPHVTVLAIHSGRGDGSGPDIENEGLYLARTLRGVDVVLCSHDHKVVPDAPYNPNGPIVLLDAGNKARNINVAVVKFLVKDGEVRRKIVEGDVFNLSDVEPSAAFEERFSSHYAAVDSFADLPVCTITDTIHFDVSLEKPSAYMTLIHEVQLEATGADVSFTAPLTTRGFIAPGVLTQADVTELYRFENKLVTITMTGRQIRDYLEFSYGNQIAGEGPTYNYDSAAGIKYRVNRKAAKGRRVSITSMADGSKFDPEREYTVAINSYRVNGGGYLLRDGAGIDPDTIEPLAEYGEVRTLLREYLSAKGEYTPHKADNWRFVK